MKTIKESIKSEIVEKKSKFIANIYFAQTMEEAENIIEKYSDDGEPAGTAGAPMLNILQKKDLVVQLVLNGSNLIIYRTQNDMFIFRQYFRQHVKSSRLGEMKQHVSIQYDFDLLHSRLG